MAKNMAFVENGIVSNILWCSDQEPETDRLMEIGDRPVAIGDSYESGKFYRNGEEVLAPLQEALKKNIELEAENETLLNDMAQMIEEVYASDMEMMGL